MTNETTSAQLPNLDSDLALNSPLPGLTQAQK
jgi:hypothetical protein